MKKITSKEIKKYLNMPYSYVVNKINDENGEYYVARELELDGLIGVVNSLLDCQKIEPCRLLFFINIP